MRRLIWAVSSGSTLFDIQSFDNKLLFKRQFVKKKKKKKADDKCRLKFDTESVNVCFYKALWNFLIEMKININLLIT